MGSWHLPVLGSRHRGPVKGQSLGSLFPTAGLILEISHLGQIRPPNAGRLVGETVDLEGRKGVCLTLATREQHYEGNAPPLTFAPMKDWCALMATVYFNPWESRI